MNGLPYYKAYPRDFVEGTIGMPFEMKCAYRVVLDLIYMQGGNLPDDARYISGLLGCSIRKWKSIREFLVDADKVQVSGDFLTNYRAEKELESLAKLQDKQRENRARPNKNKGLQKPKPDQPEPEPEPDKYKPLTPFEILSSILRDETAEDFIEHRKSLRKPLTEVAARRILSKLEGISNPDAVVDESIASGWAGVFPKEKKESKDGQAADMAKRVAERHAAKRMDSGQSASSVVPLLSAGQPTRGF